MFPSQEFDSSPLLGDILMILAQNDERNPIKHSTSMIGCWLFSGITNILKDCEHQKEKSHGKEYITDSGSLVEQNPTGHDH